MMESKGLELKYEDAVSTKDDGSPDMNATTLKKICVNHPDLYDLPEINEKLFLQYNGFTKIAGLELFPELKCLWLQNNLIPTIGTGLKSCIGLTQLYLENNQISKISGLETLVNLTDLVLSGNNITRIEGLNSLSKLTTLNLANNAIVGGLENLLFCPKLSCLDLRKNQLQSETRYPVPDNEDGETIVQLLKRLPDMRAMYLKKNPLVQTIKGYRRHLITELPSLNFLDDRRVLPIEVVAAEAFRTGGAAAERQARIDFTAKEREEFLRKHEAFKKKRAETQKGEKKVYDNGGKTKSFKVSDKQRNKFSNNGLEVKFGVDETAPTLDAIPIVVEVEDDGDEADDEKGLNGTPDTPERSDQVAAATSEQKTNDIDTSKTAATWDPAWDPFLYRLCEELVYDFDKVCTALLSNGVIADNASITKDDCRKRYAYLEGEGYDPDESDESANEDDDIEAVVVANQYDDDLDALD